MIIIYFNEFYEGKPYLDKAGMENCFGVEYCGESGFLQILALHGGITPPVATESQRQVAYYTNMLEKVKGGMYYKSFKLDPLSVSNAVLSWRDTLVAAGWDIDTGDTEKLKFIREMEPTSLPKGIADCWNEVLGRSKDSSFLPKETEIVVTQPRDRYVIPYSGGRCPCRLQELYAPCRRSGDSLFKVLCREIQWPAGFI